MDLAPLRQEKKEKEISLVTIVRYTPLKIKHRSIMEQK